MTAPSKLRPKQTAEIAFPGLGDQYIQGFLNIGGNAINVTLGMNSALTDAQLVALPPNGLATSIATQVVQHSLGTPPTVTMVFPHQTSAKAIFSVVTADNSAVYIRANSPFSNAGLDLGISARVIMIQ